jgi:hypothetical protein
VVAANEASAVAQRGRHGDKVDRLAPSLARSGPGRYACREEREVWDQMIEDDRGAHKPNRWIARGGTEGVEVEQGAERREQPDHGAVAKLEAQQPRATRRANPL